MSRRALRNCIIFGAAGVTFCLLGTVIVLILPPIVRSKIADILPLRENSESWDRWFDPPVPINYKVYLFNVSNPDEVLQGGKPRVTEIGPYVYKEQRTKVILAVDEGAGTVTYDHKLSFFFDQEASGHLNENDVLTLVNIPSLLFATMLGNLRSIHPVIQLYDTAISKMWPLSASNPAFLKVKVKDFLFDGLPIVCNQPASVNNLDVKILCKAIRVISPKAVETDGQAQDVSFAVFRHKNGTSDGVYEINTGLHDVTKIGQVLSWNGAKDLPYWKAKCNRLGGTDGTVFRPYLEEDKVETLEVYNTDACRTLKLTYTGDTEYKGIKARRYIAGEDVFGDVLKNKDNYCYSVRSINGITHYGGCIKSGVQDLSSCQGAPAFASSPHFYKADPVYQGNVDGLEPDASKHQIFLDLEPNTGYPLRAASRAQINVKMRSVREVEILKNLPNLMMPVLWMEESVELTDDLIDTINSQLLNILNIVTALQWALIGVGLCMFVMACGWYFFKIRVSREVRDQKPPAKVRSSREVPDQKPPAKVRSSREVPDQKTQSNQSTRKVQ